MPKHTFLEEQLAESEQRLRDGDKTALLDVLYYYITRGVQPPTWVKLKFYDAYAEVYDRHASSWDDVFGKPWPQRHLDDLQSLKCFAAPIVQCVEELKKTQPVDQALFEEVARRIGIGSRKVREVYYAFRGKKKGGPLNSEARELLILNPKKDTPSR
jgi:hypothetical protein